MTKKSLSAALIYGLMVLGLTGVIFASNAAPIRAEIAISAEVGGGTISNASNPSSNSNEGNFTTPANSNDSQNSA